MTICGIYSIIHRVSGRRYVGQSVNVRKRFKAHLSMLRRQTHYSRRMQRAFDRDGEAAFEFEVLEECATVDLTEREQFWLDALVSSGLYNVSTAAIAPRGYVRSAEHRAKLSAAHKGKAYALGYRHRPESKAKMSAAKIGRRLSDETKSKIGAAHRGKPKSQEHARKSGEGNRGKVVSPETRAKLAAAMRGSVASEETRAKMRAGQARARELKRQKALEQWNRPGFREAISESRKGRETRDATKLKLSEASKAMWNSDGHREFAAQRMREVARAMSPEQRSLNAKKSWEARRANSAR